MKIVRALRWSEKYTKTDMVYLTKGGFWLTLGQVISAAASFALAIAFANLLPKETYGTYKFVLSIAGILAIPTLSGMGTAVTRAVAQGYEGTVTPALRTKIRWGILSAVGSLTAAGYYWINNNTELAISFLIAAAFLPLMDSFGIYEAYLQGKKKFGKSSRYGIVVKLISVAVMIAAIFFTKSLFIILLAYFVPYTILRSIYYFIVIRKIQKNSDVQSEAIGYGKHLSLMGVIGAIANQLDKVLLFHFLGATEVAIYSIAIAPPEQIKSLSKNIHILVFPKFSNKSLEEIKESIKSKFIKLFFLSILIVGIYIAIAPWVFKTFFPQYLDSVLLSQIFSLFLLNIPFYLISTSLVAKKFIKAQYTVSITSSIFQIVSMLILLIYFGIIGVIIARVITRFYSSFANLYFFLKKDPNYKKL